MFTLVKRFFFQVSHGFSFTEAAVWFLRLRGGYNTPVLKQIHFAAFCKRWLKDGVFNFNGAKLPDISSSAEKLNTLLLVFNDTFLIPCFFKDNYDRRIVELVDAHTAEGPYGYTDGNLAAGKVFDVTVKPGDTVIDAGAWIGDFSAYAAVKGARVYAFEPVAETFALLRKTAELNGGIYPVRQGLGSGDSDMTIFIDVNNSGANSLSNTEGKQQQQTIHIGALDKFVEERGITKIDFIKADIEGAERDMLKGARGVLQKFAPKLAICTYHFPDDPEVLEKVILDANPRYTIKHLRHKLFAAVV